MADIVLGIDPGTGCTGYGVLLLEGGDITYLASNVIRPPSGEAPLAERLLFIHRRIETIIEMYRPSHCAVEDVFYAKNARSSLVLGQARAAAILAAARAGVPVASYPPRDIKKAITGNGAAHKSQVLSMLRRILVLPDIDDDNESDGLAVAYCHAARLGLARRESRIRIW